MSSYVILLLLLLSHTFMLLLLDYTWDGEFHWNSSLGSGIAAYGMSVLLLP